MSLVIHWMKKQSLALLTKNLFTTLGLLNLRVRNPGGSPADDSDSADFWAFNGTMLVRHHITPRDTLFVPTDDNCPMPLEFIDVHRHTLTS